MPGTILTEAEFLTALRHHYRIAAELLYDRYAAILYQVILCTVKDQGMADEVLAATFLFSWTAIEDFFKQDARLLLWLAGIARRLAKEKIQAGAALQLTSLITTRKQRKRNYGPGRDGPQLVLR